MSEDLFAKWFSEEKTFVKDMDDSALEAHRQELSAIAHEAKTKLMAVDEERRERAGRKANEHRTALDIDTTTGEIIKTIKTRQERLSKIERVKKTLMEKAGLSEAEAEKIVSAGASIARTKKTPEAKIQASEAVTEAVTEAVAITETEIPKPKFNPFRKG